MNKLKKDDMVLVISGREKGKRGKVLEVLADKNKVIVEKVNLVKKHMKPTQESQGGIIEIPAALHWSNVKLVCPVSDKPSRVGFDIVDGKKKRRAKISGELVEK